MTSLYLQGHVSGRVQGVWFRAFVQHHARQRGVSGWAKNTADGRVEVLLCGERAAVEAVVEQLHIVPPLARVDAVELAEETTACAPQGFVTL